ncbi:MoxR family ATPase [Candidatus Woesearchaeota archaeon]|nr:MoxR family ATPase [Candidatus Woesearchaeota archaeon]
MDIKDKLLGKKEVFTDIIGQDKAKQDIKSALLSKRNIMIVGAPGIGKTTMAKNVASELGGKFVRVQGSPDLTVEDLIGDIDPIKAMKYGPLSLEAFTKGKIFKADKGVLFFDELNRCPEKLQNALLQVLQERKCTIGSYDVDFDADIIFIATINPEDTATERMSDVLLDRFDIMYMTYPESIEHEKQIVEKYGEKICSVSGDLLHLMTYFVRLLRDDENIEKKPSVRASLGLYERSQANAVLDGRKEASFSDMKEAIISVLAHRIRLKPSIKHLECPIDYVKKKFEDFLKSDIGKELMKKSGGDG